MSNMSYCRFQNTANDLKDCEGALDELLTGDIVLSQDELYAAKRVALSCLRIIHALAEYVGEEAGEMDEKAIREAIDDASAMAKENESAIQEEEAR